MSETAQTSDTATRKQASERTAEQPAERVTPYDLIGGEEALRRIVDRFYEIMDSDPEAAAIRAMHSDDLGPIRDKLFDFLSGWLGGPPLYMKRTGSVCLTHAHAPFAIGDAERDAWLMCMRRALEDEGVAEDVREMLDRPLFMIADFIKNR
jgi:hemoglobin